MECLHNNWQYKIRYFANTIIRKINYYFSKGGFYMTRRSLMSENLKEEIAKELGVYDIVKQDGGWGNVSSKDCGNMVKTAIEIANRKV